MEVVAGIDALGPSNGRLFVVVGVFDGLHRGHHYLLRHLRSEATRRSARPAVVTFDHHPDEILQGAAPPLLCDPVERLELLARAGVAVTVVQHFDVTLRMTPFDAFVRRIADRVDLAGFLMTPDAAFGHERGGTVEAVSELGRRLGYDVAVVEPLSVDGRPVRSAEIRSDIAAGDLAGAARLLGRDVSFTGTTVRRVEATQLRFALPVALPPHGDYEARATPDGAASERRRALRIDSRGVVLAPALAVPDGLRVRVRLPVPAPAATIRRSQ
jgi:riboflavin kinase/FMN adenylyltransferase